MADDDRQHPIRRHVAESSPQLFAPCSSSSKATRQRVHMLTRFAKIPFKPGYKEHAVGVEYTKTPLKTKSAGEELPVECNRNNNNNNNSNIMKIKGCRSDCDSPRSFAVSAAPSTDTTTVASTTIASILGAAAENDESITRQYIESAPDCDADENEGDDQSFVSSLGDDDSISNLDEESSFSSASSPTSFSSVISKSFSADFVVFFLTADTKALVSDAAEVNHRSEDAEKVDVDDRYNNQDNKSDDGAIIRGHPRYRSTNADHADMGAFHDGDFSTIGSSSVSSSLSSIMTTFEDNANRNHNSNGRHPPAHAFSASTVDCVVRPKSTLEGESDDDDVSFSMESLQRENTREKLPRAFGSALSKDSKTDDAEATEMEDKVNIVSSTVGQILSAKKSMQNSTRSNTSLFKQNLPNHETIKSPVASKVKLFGSIMRRESETVLNRSSISLQAKRSSKVCVKTDQICKSESETTTGKTEAEPEIGEENRGMQQLRARTPMSKENPPNAEAIKSPVASKVRLFGSTMRRESETALHRRSLTSQARRASKVFDETDQTCKSETETTSKAQEETVTEKIDQVKALVSPTRRQQQQHPTKLSTRIFCPNLGRSSPRKVPMKQEESSGKAAGVDKTRIRRVNSLLKNFDNVESLSPQGESLPDIVAAALKPATIPPVRAIQAADKSISCPVIARSSAFTTVDRQKIRRVRSLLKNFEAIEITERDRPSSSSATSMKHDSDESLFAATLSEPATIDQVDQGSDFDASTNHESASSQEKEQNPQVSYIEFPKVGAPLQPVPGKHSVTRSYGDAKTTRDLTPVDPRSKRRSVRMLARHSTPQKLPHELIALGIKQAKADQDRPRRGGRRQNVATASDTAPVATVEKETKPKKIKAVVAQAEDPTEEPTESERGDDFHFVVKKLSSSGKFESLPQVDDSEYEESSEEGLIKELHAENIEGNVTSVINADINDDTEVPGITSPSSEHATNDQDDLESNSDGYTNGESATSEQRGHEPQTHFIKFPKLAPLQSVRGKHSVTRSYGDAETTKDLPPVDPRSKRHSVRMLARHSTPQMLPHELVALGIQQAQADQDRPRRGGRRQNVASTSDTPPVPIVEKEIKPETTIAVVAQVEDPTDEPTESEGGEERLFVVEKSSSCRNFDCLLEQYDSDDETSSEEDSLSGLPAANIDAETQEDDTEVPDIKDILKGAKKKKKKAKQSQATKSPSKMQKAVLLSESTRRQSAPSISAGQFPRRCPTAVPRNSISRRTSAPVMKLHVVQPYLTVTTTEITYKPDPEPPRSRFRSSTRRSGVFRPGQKPTRLPDERVKEQKIELRRAPAGENVDVSADKPSPQQLRKRVVKTSVTRKSFKMYVPVVEHAEEYDYHDDDSIDDPYKAEANFSPIPL